MLATISCRKWGPALVRLANELKQDLFPSLRPATITKSRLSFSASLFVMDMAMRKPCVQARRSVSMTFLNIQDTSVLVSSSIIIPFFLWEISWCFRVRPRNTCQVLMGFWKIVILDLGVSLAGRFYKDFLEWEYPNNKVFSPFIWKSSQISRIWRRQSNPAIYPVNRKEARKQSMGTGMDTL